MEEPNAFFQRNPHMLELGEGAHYMDADGFMQWLNIESRRTVNLGHFSAVKAVSTVKTCNDKRFTWSQRKKLKLCTVNKTELKFSQMLALHELWQGYMRHLLNPDELKKSGWNNSPTHPHFEQINSKLYRADFHGALITVLQSKCPSYVGLAGIIAMETKNVFKIVGKDDKCRTVMKKRSQFEFSLDGLRFTFYGHNFIVRPADRSNKKIKLIRPPTLQGK